MTKLIVSNEQKKRQSYIRSDKARKMLLASMIATTAVGAGAIVGDVGDAEAATITQWTQHSIDESFNEKFQGGFGTEYEAVDWRAANTAGGHVTYSYADNEWYVTWYVKEEKLTSRQIVSSENQYAYPNNGKHSDGYYYTYYNTIYDNRAPTAPTINVPNEVFEHGDKKTISWSKSTDLDKDAIIYELQVSSNDGGTWETLTTTANLYHDYTVPAGKTKVMFRVRATDGTAYSPYSTGSNNGVQEVQYYWSKYSNYAQPIYGTSHYIDSTFVSSNTTGGDGGGVPGYASYTLYDTPWGEKAFRMTGGFVSGELQAPGSVTTYVGSDGSSVINSTALTVNGNGTITFTTYQLSIRAGQAVIGYQDSRGTLIQNDLKAGINAYTQGAKNSDGFWYERGQRVALPDTTPPVIELTEQDNYALTSKIEVKVHDLSAIKKVKYAEGNHDANYFTTNGTDITTSFIATKNEEYTVFAEDAHGNKSVEVITVSKVNAVPEITTADTDFASYTVLDDTSSFLVKGTSRDPDGHDIAVRVGHEGIESSGLVVDGAFSVQMNGSDYTNGFYTTDLEVVPNDGYEDGEAKSVEDKIIIRVNNAAGYFANLESHDVSNEDWSKAQHEAFYHAYESIFTYEADRSPEALASALANLGTLTSIVEISDSSTLTEWQNRLDLVTATVATEKAESTLDKASFENAQTAVSGLVASTEQESLESRIVELQRYHTANDAIILMKDTPTVVTWDSINEAQSFINIVENTVNKTNLQKELTTIIKKFMSNVTTITPEDLDNFGVENVVPELGDLYDEYLDAFQPPAGDEETWAQDLVDFVNALNKALEDVTTSAVNTLHSKVPSYATTALLPVTVAVDSLLEYRQSFIREEVKDGNLATLVQAVSSGLTKDYMTTLVTVMQEVIEYNVTHDNTEKVEADAAVLSLWEGQLKSDMQAYLNNGVPEILIVEDPYEYINDGSFTVIGSIQDSNDSSHEVEVIFNGVTKTTTAAGSFSVTFDGLVPGLHEGDITIVAKDPLTSKSHNITTKPIVTVSNVELFKQFGQALSNDTAQVFNEFGPTTITSLLTIFNDTTNVSLESSDRKIRDIENAAQSLSGQEEGELEKLVKSIFLNIRLDWLINNYKTANVEDFAWAGVAGVTTSNLADLVSIMDDYVSSFTDGNVITPSLEEYQEWLTIQSTIEQVRADIEVAEAIFVSQELSDAISLVETTLANIPDWITAKQELRDRLDAITTYYNALVSVETAETTYEQADKDSAQSLVEALSANTAKDALQARLDVVQAVVDAITAVELAESTLDEVDQLAAQVLVNILADDHPKKEELQNRLNSISNINEAIEAVIQAESSYTQVDKDSAHALVEALADGPKKLELDSRLKEVQKVLDAIEAVGQAESSLVVEDILNAQLKVDAIADANPKKAELQGILDAIEELRTTIEAVGKAESTNNQSDKDAAQSMVDVLPVGDSKKALQDRLDEVQKVIDALHAIGVAESTLSDADQDIAQGLVNAIADENPIKSELQDRLDLVTQLKDAMASVDLAENSFSQADKDTANELVNALPDSPEKNALIDRLEDLQVILDKLYKEDNATDAVDKAENTFSQADKDTAKELVDALEEGPVKDALNERLDDLQDVLDSIVEIESVVATAEESKLQEDVDIAQGLLDGLASSDIKTALQDRLDEVNRYIAAEKAVTKAEENHFQKMKDAAQSLVDALQEDAAKQGLQDRLDALQLILDGKVTDLLDEIINNPNGVTPGDLADYTDETVYKELMPDYMGEIDNIGDTVTKEQVIEVIRLINSLEIAKRSMLTADIQAYENELLLTTLPTKSTYPQPAVMSAVSNYVQDDNELENVIAHMAVELNRSVEEIRDEITAILEGSMKQLAGFYTVIYQTEAGEVIHTSTIEKVAYGPVDVLADVPKGYVVVGEETHSFELTKDNKGYEVIFTVEEDLAENGDYTVKYQLEDGTIVSESVETAAYGDLTVRAELPAGYALVNDAIDHQNFTFAEDSVLEVIFIVKEVEEIAIGSYVVQYILEDLTVIEELSFTSNYGEVIVTAVVPEGYILLEAESQVKTFELEETTEGSVIQFVIQPKEIEKSPGEGTNDPNKEIEVPVNEDTTSEDGESEEETGTEDTDDSHNPVDEDQTPSVETPDTDSVDDIAAPEESPNNTLGEESAFVQSLMHIQIASLDNLYLTATPYVANGNQSSAISETHADYLYKTFYALASVKAYLENPTEDLKADAVAYITPNLHDGAFKKLLLDYLEVAITDIGDDGEPDLTPVHPTRPEPIPNPIPTPVPTPEPELTPGPSPAPNPVINIPTIPKGETIAETGKVVGVDVDNGYGWVIENPTDKTYTLKADGIEIILPLEIDASKWEISWIHVGNEHYQLSVLADGKAITAFAKPVIVKKTHGHAYLLRSHNSIYSAMPYTYNSGVFQFDTKKTGEFFFSTDKVTFKDIKNVFSKSDIEELASRHIVFGTIAEQYSPNSKITRAQFAVMLTRSLGLEASDGNSPFKDIKDKWSEKEIQALYEAGIIRGTSATTFNPNAYITREQAASMLEKVLAYSEASVYIARVGEVVTSNSSHNSIASTFNDSHQFADYAKNAIGLLQSIGVVDGKEGNIFDPKSHLTRAQMAKILTGTLKHTDKF